MERGRRVRIFKTKWFSKFAKKAAVADADLKAAALNIESLGAVAAGADDLGGDVYKLRFAREGKGTSGGYRFILFFRHGDKLFFKYAFPKSARDNIKDDELKKFKEQAKETFSFNDAQINSLIKEKILIEIL
jgi:hypothetical protein